MIDTPPGTSIGLLIVSRPHPPEGSGKGAGKLFRPNPAEVASDRCGRCLGILPGVTRERSAVLQLLENLVRIREGLLLGIGVADEEDFPDRDIPPCPWTH